MRRDELIAALIKADGAILYWQLPKDVVETVIRDGDAYIADDDCLVLREAIKIGEGAYTLRP